jgi:hypothetical protein
MEPNPAKVVPLTVWVAGERRIVGTATIIDREIHAHLDRVGDLENLIKEGIIVGVSIGFDIPPEAIQEH